MGSNRDSTQDSPCALARVDSRAALRPDGKFRLVFISKKNLHGILALGDTRIRLMEFGDIIARQILSHSISAPYAVDLPGEDLSRIEVERDLNGLSGPDP